MSDKEVFREICEDADLEDRHRLFELPTTGNHGLRSDFVTQGTIDGDASGFKPQYEIDSSKISELESTEVLHSVPRKGAFINPRVVETKLEMGVGPETGDNDGPLNFLQPTSKEGSLGRLGGYEIIQVLGRGAFGIVLKAFDEMLQRMVAIKVLAPELAATSPARKRFLREARSSAAIRHEHVVHIYAVDELPVSHIVMELVPGRTIQQRIDESGPLEIHEVLQIGQQIASGLAAAHAMGIIHRDIKPANIILEPINRFVGRGAHVPANTLVETLNQITPPLGNDSESRVKITDFGLARAADDASLTHSGVVAGTPMYMSPEQAQGKHLDARSDLFSLGSVLYVMASGRPPFRATTTFAVLKRVVEEDAASDKRNPTIRS